jgi:hypothetical protein
MHEDKVGERMRCGGEGKRNIRDMTNVKEERGEEMKN